MHRHMHAGLPILPLVLRYLPWADLRRFARTLRGGEREERLLRQHVQGRRVARFVAAMHRSAPWRDTKAHPLGDYNPGRATMWSRSHVGYQYDRRLLLRFMAQDDVYRRRDARTTARDLVRRFPGATPQVRHRRLALAEVAEASNSRWDLLPLVRTLNHDEITDHGI